MTDKMDISSKESLSDKQLKQALLHEQALIVKELQANHGITPLTYNPDAKVLRIPRIHQSAAFTIKLAPEHCRTRQLMFGVFNAAAYRYLMTDDFSEFRKLSLRICKHVWRFFDVTDLTAEKCVTWLKDFEAWRVNEDGVKTQSTGLEKIKLMIDAALSLGVFTETLSDFEREYLVTLANTPVAPREGADAVNLNQWFSQHTWLRRDDVGIGHELYTRLGSPKALMNSFRITIENALLYLQACKDALIDSFRLADITPDDIPTLADITLPNGRPKHYDIIVAKTEIFNRLRKRLVPLFDDIFHLKHALELVVFTEAKPQHREYIFEKLLANQPIIPTSRTQCSGYFISTQDVGFFDFGFLRQLALHAVSPPDNDIMPTSVTESLLFSYLMAYQTVQASDIPRLALRDFKFVKRIDGAITHIESHYFKGRAKNKIHQVETLKTKDNIGKAVIRYLKDVTSLRERDKLLAPEIKKNICSPINATGLLCLAFTGTALWQVINEKHKAQRVAPVFPKVIHAMLSNGVRHSGLKKTRTLCETNMPDLFFGFAHIKTSAVYAGSENFDPTSLVNLRSHTNESERSHYLTEMNQEWLDNCGLVTRAVMRDLYVNVFSASESDRQLFESEFTVAIEHIKARANDVLACLKVVTRQTSGRIDELGIVSTNTQIDGDLPDTIYIQDSPETVMKLKQFLAQLQKKHALLRECSPEFLFFSALPTAEWIESLFENKRFSKASLQKGQEWFDKYQSHLPPHFTAQLS